MYGPFVEPEDLASATTRTFGRHVPAFAGAGCSARAKRRSDRFVGGSRRHRGLIGVVGMPRLRSGWSRRFLQVILMGFAQLGLEFMQTFIAGSILPSALTAKPNNGSI